MEFEDKKIICVDCGKEWIWEKSDQFYFYGRGLTPPKRCLECRAKRRFTLESNKWRVK
jgi:hypothetical protein